MKKRSLVVTAVVVFGVALVGTCVWRSSQSGDETSTPPVSSVPVEHEKFDSAADAAAASAFTLASVPDAAPTPEPVLPPVPPTDPHAALRTDIRTWLRIMGSAKVKMNYERQFLIKAEPRLAAAAVQLETENAFFNTRRLEDSLGVILDSSIYPGNLVQVNGLVENQQPTPVICPRTGTQVAIRFVVPTARKPGEATTTETATHATKSLLHNDLADYTTAMKEWISASGDGLFKSVPNYSLLVQQAYSQDQLELKFNVKGRYSFVSAGMDIRTEKRRENADVFVMCRQAYFAVDVIPPTTPEGWFDLEELAKSSNFQLLKDQIASTAGAGSGIANAFSNSVAYISSVTYGRIFIAAFSASNNSSELYRAVHAAVHSPMTDVTSGLTTSQKSALQQSTCKILAVGGEPFVAEKGAEISSGIDGVSAFMKMIRNGTSFQPNDQWLTVPIGFSAAYVWDNKPVARNEVSWHTLLESSNPIPLRAEARVNQIRINDDEDDRLFSGTGEWEFRLELNDRQGNPWHADWHDDSTYTPDWRTADDASQNPCKVTIWAKEDDEEEHDTNWLESVDLVGHLALDAEEEALLQRRSASPKRIVAVGKHGNEYEVGVVGKLPRQLYEELRDKRAEIARKAEERKHAEDSK